MDLHNFLIFVALAKFVFLLSHPVPVLPSIYISKFRFGYTRFSFIPLDFNLFCMKIFKPFSHIMCPQVYLPRVNYPFCYLLFPFSLKICRCSHVWHMVVQRYPLALNSPVSIHFSMSSFFICSLEIYIPSFCC